MVKKKKEIEQEQQKQLVKPDFTRSNKMVRNTGFIFAAAAAFVIAGVLTAGLSVAAAAVFATAVVVGRALHIRSVRNGEIKRAEDHNKSFDKTPNKQNSQSPADNKPKPPKDKPSIKDAHQSNKKDADFIKGWREWEKNNGKGVERIKKIDSFKGTDKESYRVRLIEQSQAAYNVHLIEHPKNKAQAKGRELPELDGLPSSKDKKLQSKQNPHDQPPKSPKPK